MKLLKFHPKALALAAASVGVLGVAGCALDSPYLDPDGPRYSGDFTVGEPEPDGELRVVAFNLEFGMDVPVAVVALQSPELANFDLLLMQEQTPESCDEIAAALGLRYVYYPATVKRGGDFGNVVFSPWPLGDDKKILLPHADPYVGSKRIAVFAEAMIEGTPIAAYSAHTATVTLGLGARLDQAEAIAIDAEGRSSIVVIGGDFNTADPGSDTQTVDLLANYGLGYASPDATDTGSGLGQRFTLDYIFARGIESRSSGTYQPDAGSDHQPVWAIFDL